MTDPFAIPAPDTRVIGTGRLTLDVIVRAGEPRAAARSQAGGTCGNVLANLAWLGWSAWPLTDLGDDDPGRRIAADLRRWGVCLDLVRYVPEAETPVIIHHIQGSVHSFSSRCPFCGRRLQYYEPVSLPRVEERLAEVPTAKVFFFDRDSEGALLLARHCKEQGALVIYEPNYAGKESNLAAALAVADVLKVSRERLPGLADRVQGPQLVIETRGAEGLRWRRETWVEMPALPVAVVRDTGGSGDWCTAGFVHRIGQGGLGSDEQVFCEALRFGQALGAWNCAFEGARGGVYQASREQIQTDVRRLLAGECFDPGAEMQTSTHDVAGAYCPGCR